MPGRPALAALAIAAVALPAPAWANAYAFPIDIRPKPLAAALQELARQTGIELLYDRQLVRGMRAPAVRGRMTIDAALARLLDGSDLVARRASSGAWLIARRPAVTEAVVAEAVEGPELLVSGRLTQNVDIRRRENDVQPYQVSTGEQIRRAHRDNLDQYFRSRATSNADRIPPSLLGEGAANSRIDLRGLGTDNTLILIDGRRVPSIPVTSISFDQPDLNAIPLHAIERVETLTGTAGGIHGFGALGGVVNVVLKREYRGAELHVTSGITSRGDGRRLALEGRIGFTPNGGRTDVMIHVGRSREQGLLVRSRDYLVRDREAIAARLPDRLATTLHIANSVGIYDANFESIFGLPDMPLTFKPQYGGVALTSDYTFLPNGFGGDPQDLVAILAGNAGKVDTSLSEGDAVTQLGSAAHVTSAMFNVRHRFGGSVEGYFDALILRNHGRHSERGAEGFLFLDPADPRNPFEQYIFVTYPVAPQRAVRRTRFESERYTAGLLWSLPHEWRGTAEATFGAHRYSVLNTGADLYTEAYLPSFGIEFNPFGKWEEFQRIASSPAYRATSRYSSQSRNHYQEQSLRLSGPVFSLSGGNATLTLLGQRRKERIPAIVFGGAVDYPDGPATLDYEYAARKLVTHAAYAELRAPIFGDSAPIPLLDRLELQLAGRYDRQRFDYSTTPFEPVPESIERTRFIGGAYTIGARAFPFSWMMIRGSYATGAQPPPLGALIPYQSVSTFHLFTDPERGDSYVGTEGAVLVQSQGSPDATTVRANTLSLGVVLNPFGDSGPRVSIDYSRIRKSRDIYYPDGATILAHPQLWPERILREPLTDADRALGYTAGRLLMVDARAMNAGRQQVQSIDGRLDWSLPLGSGTLRTYGAVTLNLRHARIGLAGKEEWLGYADGPLEWRANVGADWTAGATTIGGNLQYFDRYIVYPREFAAIGDTYVEEQGSRWVRAQAYLDLYAAQRFRIGQGQREVTVELAVVNVLDQAPPRQTSNFDAYSFYGDPRRRRFELTLSAAF